MIFEKVRLTHTGGGIYVLTGRNLTNGLWYMLDQWCCGYAYKTEEKMWEAMGDGVEIDDQKGLIIAAEMSSHLSLEERQLVEKHFRFWRYK